MIEGVITRPKRPAHRREQPLLPARAGLPVELAGLLILPLVMFFGLRADPFSLASGIDSFVYLGYSQNASDLIARYGLTYPAVRFGLLLPQQLAFHLFGAVGGFFALRYVLAVLMAGVLYLLARRNGSRAAGWLGAVMCLSSPILLRALMANYADTTGLPFLLIGTACLLMPTSRRRWWAFAAGTSYGLAVHSQIFVLAILVVVIPARLFLQLLRREFSVLLDYTVMVLGILLVTGLGSLYYWQKFGSGNVLRPTLAFVKANSSGALARDYRAPTLAWFGFSLYLYVPVVVMFALAVTLLTQPVDGSRTRFGSMLASPLADVLVMALAAEGFYFFQEFLLNGYSLEYFWYASYLFAFAAIGLTLVIVGLATRPGSSARVAWLACAVAVALPVARNGLFRGFGFWAWPAVPLMVVATGVPLLWSRRSALLLQLGAVGLVGSVVLLSLCPPRNVPLSPGQTNRADPRYNAAIGSTSRLGLDWFEMASRLIAVTPRWSGDPGTILFWYPSDLMITVIQSTYSWLPDTIQYTDPGLPALNVSQIAELRGRTPRTIVMLTRTADELVSGRSALIGAGLKPMDITDSRVHSGQSTMYVERLTFQAAPCDQEWRTVDVPWRHMRPTCT